MGNPNQEAYVKVKERTLAEFRQALDAAPASEARDAAERVYLDAKESLERVKLAEERELGDVEELADRTFEEAHARFRALG